MFSSIPSARRKTRGLAPAVVLIVAGCSPAPDAGEGLGRAGIELAAPPSPSPPKVGVPVVVGGSGGGITSSPVGDPHASAVLGFSPNHGAVLYHNLNFTSPWYDPVTGLIDVRGTVTGVPADLINSGKLRVVADGTIVGAITAASAANGEVWFELRVPARVDHYWVQRTILVELIDTGNNHVVARASNTYFDLRREEDTRVDAKIEQIAEGIGAQLTDTGIGRGPTTDRMEALEGPHLATLPYPSLTSFNQDLGDAALALPLDQGVTAATCIPLDELDSRFSTQTHYLKALASATALYGVYEAYQSGGETACNSAAAALGAAAPIVGFLATAACASAMSGWCVKSPPKRSDFELCVDRIDGDPTDLDIDGVSDVQLAWTTGGTLTAQIEVEGIEGSIDGLLRGLKIRWADRSCSAPPSANIPDTALTKGDWLQDFATCEDLVLKSPRAATDVTTGAQFLVAKSSTDKEAVRVTQSLAPVLAFDAPDVDARRGTCANDALLPHAEALVFGYETRLEGVLNDTWNAGGSRSQQAQALEELLSPLNLGAPGHAVYRETLSFGPVASQAAAGAAFEWATRVEAVDSLTRQRMRIGQMYREAHPAPYFDDGRTDNGMAFDFSYTITTGYLNQILHVFGGSDLVHFPYVPTWDDVAAWGATPANTGHPADKPPPLDGAVLSHLHSAFAELGATRLEVSVRPTLDPMVWMNPDPPPPYEDPRTGTALAYGLGALEVVFTAPSSVDPVTQKPIPSAEWLRIKFSIWEPELRFGLGTGSNVLSTFADFPNYTVITELTRFTGCPKVPHGNYEPATSCERDLEGALATLLYNLMRPRLMEMVSKIPSPNVWDAGGLVGQAPELRQLARYQLDQKVTFFADIPDW